VSEVNENNVKYKVIVCNLKKVKNGPEQALPIYPHRDTFHEDYYFSLLYLFLMNYVTGRQMNNYLFPMFSEKACSEKSGKGLESKVSKHWTKMFVELKKFLKHLVINDNLTSHHGKKGSSQKMSEIPFVSGLAQIFRAGWMVRGLHSLFDYVVGSNPHVAAAGKALANWTQKFNDTIHGGIPPTIDSIVTESHLVPGFVDTLFTFDIDNRIPLSLRNILVGTLLRHYAQFESVVQAEPDRSFRDPQNHTFIALVHQALSMAGVSQVTFQAWQKEVRTAFWQANVMSLPIQNFPRELFDERYRIDEIQIDPHHPAIGTSPSGKSESHPCIQFHSLHQGRAWHNYQYPHTSWVSCTSW
jgi:hypothetical protein